MFPKFWRIFAPLIQLLNGNLEDYEVGIDLKEKGEDSSSCGFSPFLFFICMFKENVYMIEEVGTGIKKLYDEANLAALDLGVSVQHMWRCNKKGLICKNHRIIGWKQRMYLIRYRENNVWVYDLCSVNNRKDVFVAINKGKAIKIDDAASVKDASELCYC